MTITNDGTSVPTEADIEAVPDAEPPPGKPNRSIKDWYGDLKEAAGPVGLFPLFVLLGLAAVERFDAQAFGVLGPEIRKTFHLSDGGFQAVFNLTTILPLFLAVYVGFLGDKRSRTQLTSIGG